MSSVPKHLDLVREKGLHIEWDDGSTCFLPASLLRRMSPSADSKSLREELEENPLAILPSSSTKSVIIENAEFVGNYAIRLIFSDGHSTGIYTWEYLRSLAPPQS